MAKSSFRVGILVVATMTVLFGFGAETYEVVSPDGNLTLSFGNPEGEMTWSLRSKAGEIVKPSPLGLAFADHMGRGGGNCVELTRDMEVKGCVRSSHDETWFTTLYKKNAVRNRYNEMKIVLARKGGAFPRVLGLEFRMYDDGAAFRYELPEQEGGEGFQLMHERTQWRFEQGTEGWFTAYDSVFNGQEEPFIKRRIADIKPKEVVGMPAIVQTAGGTVALCEAALVNWAGIYFNAGNDALKALITPLPRSEAATANVAVIRTLPAKSPWRVAICAKDELDLLRHNDIIQNLNPPPEEGIDFSWVKAGPSSWDWWTESNNSLSTELTLKMVDFAAEAGWAYHTIDGGWYGFARRPNHGPGVKLEPRKTFDLRKVVKRANEKGIGIWVWIHWELINDIGIEETFARLEKWGVKGVKTDFLNRQDQWIVNWYENVCRAAAKHHVMVNFHGAFKPTGTERTWPNNLTREGILGNEFNIFNFRITPEHVATLPFTRFLLGPGDFTPGGFGNVFSKDFVPQVKKGHRYGDETDRCPHWAEERGTRCHALALCVSFDSRLMTLCDWPERYRGAAGFEVLRNLPAAWKETIPLEGVCGEHYAVAREAFDGRRFVAAFTVKARKTAFKLDFLGKGKFKMELFADDPEKTPSDAKVLKKTVKTVTASDMLSLDLLDEGGAVAVFTPVE